jgi:hypothetical protein
VLIYSKTSILPNIASGSVIVMDNATFHKRQDSVEALRRDGKILEYLPTYSPDLNPKPDEPEPKRGYDVGLANAIGGHYAGERLDGAVRSQPAWGVVLF